MKKYIKRNRCINMKEELTSQILKLMIVWATNSGSASNNELDSEEPNAEKLKLPFLAPKSDKCNSKPHLYHLCHMKRCICMEMDNNNCV